MEATENQIKALRLIKEGPVTGIKFAERMWPDSNMHKKGNRMVNSYGLSYLYKLKDRGWLDFKNHTFTLSREGESILTNI